MCTHPGQVVGEKVVGKYSIKIPPRTVHSQQILGAPRGRGLKVSLEDPETLDIGDNLDVSKVLDGVDADGNDDRKCFRPGKHIHHELRHYREAGARPSESEPEVRVGSVGDPLDLSTWAIDQHAVLGQPRLPPVTQHRLHHDHVLCSPTEPSRGSQSVDTSTQQIASDPDIETLAVDHGVLGGRYEVQDPAPGAARAQHGRQAGRTPPGLDQSDRVELPQVQVEAFVLTSHINIVQVNTLDKIAHVRP